MSKQNRVPTNASQPLVDLSSLEQWGYSILTRDNPDTLGRLSRFGLKTATDVLIFFRSPEGKNVLAELNLHLALEEQLKHNQQINIQEQESASHRLKAALFLWFIKEKAHAAAQQQELILQQIAKTIQESGASPTASTASTSPQKIVHNALADYVEAQLINKEYALFNDKEYKELVTDLAQLQAKTELIEGKYTALTEALTKLTFSSDELNNINQKIEEKRRLLDQYMREDNDVETANILNDLIVLFAELSSFQEVNLDKNTHYYANESGEEVHSYSEAYFILDIINLPNPDNPQQFIAQKSRIIQDELGVYYLLKPGQDWSLIKVNPQLKEQARKEFERQKPSLMLTKTAVLENKGLELQHNNEQIAENQKKTVENQATKLLLQNQNLMLTAAISQTQALLNNPSLSENSTLTPMPVPTSKANGPKPGVSIASVKAAQYYSEQFLALRKTGLNYDSLLGLRDQLLLRGDTPRANALIFQLQNIPRTGPIPFLMMQSLIKNMELIGVDPNNPAVTALKSPLDLANNPTPEASKPLKHHPKTEENEHTSTAPQPKFYKKTPFE